MVSEHPALQRVSYAARRTHAGGAALAKRGVRRRTRPRRQARVGIKKGSLRKSRRGSTTVGGLVAVDGSPALPYYP